MVFSNYLMGMDLAEEHKTCLLKFMHSSPSTIENNIQEIIAFTEKKPIEKDSRIQEPLNKVLATLATLWDSQFEKSGLKLAHILIAAGADPCAQIIVNERNYWRKESSASGAEGECRECETSYRSTVLEQSRGSLQVYLKDYLLVARK